MKTMKKCTLLLIVAFTLSLAAGIFGLTAAFNKTVFAVEGANVAMVDGASVKINGTGIRFQSLIKKTYYDGLAEGKKTGIAIIPADLLQGELNQSTDKAMLLYAAAQAHDDEKYAGYYVYNYALTDIPETSFGRKMTARAFVKNGEEYIWADNVQSRSLAYVASAALQADSMGEVEYDDSQRNVLKGYINSSVDSIAVSAYTQTITVGTTENAVGLKITPKYATDDLSDLKVVYTSDNTDAVSSMGDELVANKAGFARVTAKLGAKAAIIRVFSNETTYILSAVAESQAIEYSLPTGCTAELFLNDSTPLGSVDNIVIPDTIKGDKTQHKMYAAGSSVKLVISGDGASKLTRPSISIATASISSLDDWKKYIWSTDAAAKVSGYYVLTNDIEQGGEAFNLTGERSVGNGFVGTVDGGNHSISLSGSNGFGLFGGMDGATVKNLIINKNGGSAGWSAGLLGSYVQNSTFDNVTINITGANNGDTRIGEFTRRGVWSSKFNKFTVNITNSKIASLFGAEDQKYRGFNANNQNCTFTDSKITLDVPSTMDEIGHYGKVSADNADHPLTVYTAEGHTPANVVEWATVKTLTGITVVKAQPTEQTLSRQNISLAADAAAIDLGGYSDYTVTEITCDGEDLGKNPQNLALTENIKKKQGKL